MLAILCVGTHACLECSHSRICCASIHLQESIWMSPSIILAAAWVDRIGLLAVIVPLGGVGLILVIGGIFGLLQRIVLLVFGCRTSGTLLGYYGHDEEFVGFHRRETIPGTFQIPRFRFVDDQGRTHEADAIGTKTPRYQVGQTVPVIYLRHRPKSCMINHFLDIWGGPLMMLGVGLVPLAMSVWMFLGMW